MGQAKWVLSIAAILLVPAAGRAAPIFTVSGGASAIETGNDFLWIDSPVTEGGSLEVSEPAILTIEYIGKEAGFVDTEFWFGSLAHPGGILIATTGAAPPIIEGQTASLPFPPPGIVRGLAPHSTSLAAGVVPFHFRVPDSAGVVVANGDPSIPEAADLAFWWRSTTGSLGNTVYVLLDDGGGLNPGEPSDNDHDDMIVRLTVTPIPEPGTSALVLLGLGLVGAARRRRSQ